MVFCRILLLVLVITQMLCDATRKFRMGPEGTIARIVNPQDYPYVVEIAAASTGRSPYTLLTGVLLSRSLVLTAGHGFFDVNGKPVRQFARVTFPSASDGMKFRINSTGQFYGRLIHPPDNQPFFGELVDFAIFSLSRSLPICEVYNESTAADSSHKFPIIKLPILDVKSEQWEARGIDRHQLKDCVFLGYGETDQGPADGKLRMQDHVQVFSINRRLLIPLNLTTMLGRACPGDSGAPLICRDDDGEERLYGMLSNSETSIPGQKRSCFTDKATFMFDILTDIRYILPFIRSSLLEMGKLNELIEDYEKCGYRSDRRIEILKNVIGSSGIRLLEECCDWLKEKPEMCGKFKVSKGIFKDKKLEYVEERIGNFTLNKICALLFSFSADILSTPLSTHQKLH